MKGTKVILKLKLCLSFLFDNRSPPAIDYALFNRNGKCRALIEQYKLN